MEIRLEMGNWVINDEYFIAETMIGYGVYNCGTDECEVECMFESQYFENCLTWIWNSL